MNWSLKKHTILFAIILLVVCSMFAVYKLAKIDIWFVTIAIYIGLFLLIISNILLSKKRNKER
jgi:heme O synthase-like polyprenyltransferase